MTNQVTQPLTASESNINRIRATAMLIAMVYAILEFFSPSVLGKRRMRCRPSIFDKVYSVGCSRSTAQRKWINSRPILIHVKTTWAQSKQDAFETGQRTSCLQTGQFAQDVALTSANKSRRLKPVSSSETLQVFDLKEVVHSR